MKLRIKSMIWNIISKNQPTRTRKKNLKKNEDSVRSLWDNFECSDIRITGVPGGEEKEQEIGN